jgi:hypothetical protein
MMLPVHLRISLRVFCGSNGTHYAALMDLYADTEATVREVALRHQMPESTLRTLKERFAVALEQAAEAEGMTPRQLLSA